MACLEAVASLFSSCMWSGVFSYLSVTFQYYSVGSMNTGFRTSGTTPVVGLKVVHAPSRSHRGIVALDADEGVGTPKRVAPVTIANTGRL